MIKLLLIGAGRWGQNYISTLSSFKNVNLIIANRDNWKSLIDAGPDGVIVCTPPQSHIEISSYSLHQNIPTMIEKPLSLSLVEAESLSKFTAPILVNHIHLFSDSYQNLKKIASNQNITSITSLGFNNGPIRDYSSLWDYGCHDLAMILDIVQDYPQRFLIEELKTDAGSLFNIKLDFKNFWSESLVGNGAKKRVRKFKIEFQGLKLSYDGAQKPASHLPPLTNALNIFINSIQGKSDPRLGLDLSLKVVKSLETLQNLLPSTAN